MSDTQTTDLLVQLSENLASAVDKASGSIVSVYARRRHNPASGIVWSSGVILTADHTLERDEDVVIGLPDGKEVPATIAGRDPGTDLAILKFAGDGPAPIARGAAPRVGHFVLAVGRPGSISATSGIVSAIGGPTRTWRGGMLDGFIKTDAVLYQGFSGGALIDASGAAVGLLTTHFGSGGLAIPVATLVRVGDTLAAHGKIRRGYLGVTSQAIKVSENIRPLSDQLGDEGLIVLGVESKGPADAAGVTVGDVFVTLNGQAIHDTDDLQSVLGGDTIGKPATLVVVRGGKLETLTVTVGERQ